ncbi:hypothetical protein J4225_03865 [Candidatus Pacearchaeota archaeon]|nr:hypothetical protein [Candidatus Pacearchaeota archaeon]
MNRYKIFIEPVGNECGRFDIIVGRAKYAFNYESSTMSGESAKLSQKGLLRVAKNIIKEFKRPNKQLEFTIKVKD